ncbi:MAG: hypothetical protein HY352_04395 [Candidatus Omnitrophica bacterium]|nr:hypothetical protein [Candidatus Omnitrophota bacterium]
MFGKAARPAPPTPGSAPSKGNRTSITETAPCQKSLKLHVGQEGLAPIRASVLAEFQRQAILPGFRKGKAPVDLIEKQYAQNIHEETLSRATKQACEEAAKTYELKPVGPFEISAANFSETDGLMLEARVEVEPAFTVVDYKGILLKRPSLTVTTEEMKKALADLQESMTQLVPVGEGTEKERRVPALDDGLAKDVGFENLEKLNVHVEAKLREQKQAAQTEALESDLCDVLLQRHAFEVPPRLVVKQSERLTRDFKARLLLSGIAEEKVEEEAKKFTDQLRTSAERQVKLAFILDRIATKESVTVTQDELVKRLWDLSQRWKKDPAEVRKMFDAQGLWPSVISNIRQEKTMAWLLAAAVIEEASIPADPQPTSAIGQQGQRSQHITGKK